MGTTADKLNKLLNTKQAIKRAIINKGVDVGDDVKFSDYPAKINSIESGGSGEGGNNELTWNVVTDNGTRGAYLFYGCNDLTELDVSNLDTSYMTSMSYMFYNCKSLTTLDLSNFDGTNVTNMSYMFYNCKSLTTLDLSGFNASKVANIANMFNGCTSLTTLDLSGLDVTSLIVASYTSNAFNNCTALVDFYPPNNINGVMSFSSCTNLSHDSLMRIINNLMTTTITRTLTLGTTNLAKLSDEEKAIATGKGWTLK